MSDELIDYDPYSWETVEELTAKLLSRLAQTIPGGVDSLKIVLDGDDAFLTGMVHSEEARSVTVRTLAAFLKRHAIKDLVEVAGFLEPATDNWFIDDPWDNTPARAGAGDDDKQASEPVVRYPTVTCSDDLIAGQNVTIEVDLLSKQPDPSADAVVLADLHPGWGEITVLAVITSRAFDDIGGECAIVVREDGSSIAARITVQLRTDLKVGDEVKIDVGFTVAGRKCASVSVSLGKLAESAPSSSLVQSIALPAQSDPVAPRLTVNIFGIDEDLIWSWDFAPGTAAPRLPRMARKSLKAMPSEFAAKLTRKCPQMRSSDLRLQMGSIGDEIWQATPPDFKATYTHLRENHGEDFPIQFFMENFHVPWEMMRPVGGNHLFFTHPVGRWTMTRSDVPSSLPAGEKFSFVPEYEAQGTLPAARDEQAWLCTNLGARKDIAEKTRFIQLLIGNNMPKTALIHFAGHGAAATDNDDASLNMEDASVYILDVNNREIELGDRDRSVVILNACEAGTVKNSLAWVEGWAPVLTEKGFGAVVAPLWSVQDRAACDLVVAGLEGLYNRRETIGEAFATARLAGASRSPAAFAFLVYGDVMARVE